MITQRQLKRLYKYRKKKGGFKRRIMYKDAFTVGCMTSHGYISAMVEGERAYIHRLVWLWHHGYMPEQVDHINRDRSDNRIENLRAVTQTENNMNLGKRVDNTSGHKGVSWNKRKCRWYAYLNLDGTRMNLGSFTKYSDAVDARVNAEVLYGFYPQDVSDAE